MTVKLRKYVYIYNSQNATLLSGRSNNQFYRRSVEIYFYNKKIYDSHAVAIRGSNNFQEWQEKNIQNSFLLILTAILLFTQSRLMDPCSFSSCLPNDGVSCIQNIHSKCFLRFIVITVVHRRICITFSVESATRTTNNGCTAQLKNRFRWWFLTITVANGQSFLFLVVTRFHTAITENANLHGFSCTRPHACAHVKLKYNMAFCLVIPLL